MNERLIRLVITILVMALNIDNKYAVMLTMYTDEIVVFINYIFSFKRKKNTVVVTNDGDGTVLYKKYLLYYNNINRKIESCDAFYDKGFVNKTISKLINGYVDNFEKNVIKVKHLPQVENDNKIIEHGMFVFECKDGIDVIMRYLNFIVTIKHERGVSSIFTYEPTHYLRLIEQNVELNKTFENTIYDVSVKNTIINNIEFFLNNKDCYDHHGKPYKIGFMFHGPPGTGKTSIVKILAKKYDMPIFVLDLANITCNSQLREFVMEIDNCIEYNQKYIVLIEDIDNSSLFKSDKVNTSSISMDALLNMIDGVRETPGRVLILTSNTYIVDKIPALFRPGRIDHIIKINYCTNRQVIDIIKYFKPGAFVSKKIKFRNNITAAELSAMVSGVDKLPSILQKISVEKK